MADRLLPCPHCGTAAVVTSCPMNGEVAVECADRCLIALDKPEAIRRWNRRHGEETP